MYIEKEINLQDKQAKQQVLDLLSHFDLSFSEDMDYTMGLYDGERLIATGSLSGRVLRDLAIDPDYQGQKLTRRIVNHLVDKAKELGVNGYQIFTKPENAPIFERMDFTCVAMAEPYAALLEAGENTLEDFLETAKLQVGEPVEGTIRGSIVMNCNPFTNGHRALIQYTAERCDDVVVFVVQEDRSLFPFADRLELVRKGVSDLENIHVISGGDYIISNATFPTYFIKGTDALDAQTELDATVFAERIAPALGITVRFVGEEPTDMTTRAYNRALAKILPMNELGFHIIPRERENGEIISASKVRAALAKDNWELVENFVPATTLEYLRGPRGAEVIEKIKEDFRNKESKRRQ